MNNEVQPYYVEEEEINLIDYVRLLWKYKFAIIIICVLTVTGAVVILLFFTADMYESTASIMPLKSSGGSGALSALQGIVPGGFLRAQPESDIGRFVNILKSRTLAEQVVRDNKLDLENRLYKDVPEDERPEFQKIVNKLRNGIVNISDTKEGLILVKAKVAEAPQLAADISNKYLELLEAYLKENILTSAKRNREFVEEQYKKTESNLYEAEKRLQEFKDKHGLISIDNQTKEMTETIGTLKGRLMGKNVELQVMENSGVSKASFQYEITKLEIEALKKQIDSLEKSTQKSDISYVAFEELPELEREYTQLMRDKTVQETLYTMLAQEYEQAKIAEDRDEPAFLTIDEAIAPIEPGNMSKKVIVLLSGVFGLILSVMYIFIAWAFKGVKLSDITSKEPTGENAKAC